MYLARAILGLCVVVSGCNVVLQGPDTETDEDGGSTTSETESSSESVTSGGGMTTEPATTASTTTTSKTTGGTTGVTDTMESEGSTDTSGSNETTSAGSSEGESTESSTTDPDGHPLEGTYGGTMAADCVVGLLSGVLEFDVDASGGVDGEAAVSFGAGGPIVAPVEGSVDESGAIEATATIGGGFGSCDVTGTLFDSGTGSGVFTCPGPVCDGTWIAN